MRTRNTAKCLEPGCDKTYHAMGYCNNHYQAHKLKGHLPKVRDRVIFDNLRDKFDNWWMPLTESSCWAWIGPLFKSGYGQICEIKSTRNRKANRVAYELYKGPLPENVVIRHTCDNKWCVNPNHLLPGTHQDNVDDMVGRKRHPHGETHGMAKLNEEDVRAIRTSPDSLSATARMYDVSSFAIYAIRSGKTWKHVV